jgi:DNA-binding NtrC family response regulator
MPTEAGTALRVISSAKGTATKDHAASPALHRPPTPWPAAIKALSSRVAHFGGLASRSSSVHSMFELLDRYSPRDVTVTLLGETGVGKDVIARALHAASRRANEPFVVFDCGAVANNLAESELLGHERGSFTGAIAGHAGAFERANGGTLFLDEIAELPIDLQPRLLRALESRSVRRVGGKLDRRVDVRIVAATHRDLRARVASGTFREDLYYRLAVGVVPVPALRERLTDLPILVPKILADLGYPEMRVADATYDALAAHDWPGNIRELKNALACATAFCDSGSNMIFPRHVRTIAQSMPLASAATGCPGGIDHLPLGGMSLEEIERVAIRQTLVQTEGNKADAARSLGIAVSTLYEKLKKHGL